MKSRGEFNPRAMGEALPEFEPPSKPGRALESEDVY